MNAATGHVVLLGDSIFDNAAYVRGGPDVVAQLADAAGEFARRYDALLARIAAERATGQRVAVCTIYHGNLGGDVQRAATAALAI